METEVFEIYDVLTAKKAVEKLLEWKKAKTKEVYIFQFQERDAEGSPIGHRYYLFAVACEKDKGLVVFSTSITDFSGSGGAIYEYLFREGGLKKLEVAGFFIGTFYVYRGFATALRAIFNYYFEKGMEFKVPEV